MLTGLFELGGELRAAIDLHSANGKRHAVQQSFQELSGVLSGGSAVGLDHVPARDHIAGGELFEDHAGHRAHLQGIDLDEVTRLGNRILLGFAHGVGTDAQCPARSRNGGSGFPQARPRCFSRVRMRPTMEVEMPSPPCRSSTAKPSLPSAETATAKSKPCFLRETTKSAGGTDGDDDCPLPSCSNPVAHSASASDKRSGARSRNAGWSGPRFASCDRNPSNSGGPVPPEPNSTPIELSVPLGPVYPIWVASKHST